MTKPKFPPLESLTPEQLLRLSKAYRKGGMKELYDPAERERLFRVADLTRGAGKLKAKRLIKIQCQNDRLVNHVASRWLMLAKVTPDPYQLHLLTLAQWGFANGAEGDWPEDLADVVEMQLGDLAWWKPEDLMRWLFSDENQGDPQEQEQDLLHYLKVADSPLCAAEMVLCTIWYTTINDSARLDALLRRSLLKGRQGRRCKKQV